MDAMNDDFDAQHALAAVRAARGDLATRVGERSWSYDSVYGALAGAMVAGQALPLPLNILASTLGVVGLTVLARSWARRTGVWVGGMDPRGARWVSLGLGAVIALLSFGVLWAGRAGEAWIAAPAGLAAALVAIAGSRLWRRLYLRGLERDFAAPDPSGLNAPGIVLSAIGAVMLLAAGALYAGGWADAFWTGCMIGTGLVLLAAPLLLRLKRGLGSAR